MTAIVTLNVVRPGPKGKAKVTGDVLNATESSIYCTIFLKIDVTLSLKEYRCS